MLRTAAAGAGSALLLAALVLTMAGAAAAAGKPTVLSTPTTAVTVTPIAPLGAPAGHRATAKTISDAIQLLQLEAADEVEVPDDAIGRTAIEQQIKRPTRVRTIARTLQDLGGDGCKRIELLFIGLDLPVQDKDGRQGMWSVAMQWSLCHGGMPSERG